MKKVIVTDFGKIEIDLNDVLTRMVHTGTKMGVQIRETRHFVKTEVNDEGQRTGIKVGDELAFPYYIDMVTGKNQKSQKSSRYSLVFCKNTESFALRAMNTGKLGECSPFHSMNGDKQAELIRDIAEAIGKGVPREELAVVPAFYKLLSEQGSTDRSKNKERVEPLEEDVAILRQFIALAYRGKINGQPIIPNQEKYDKLTGKTFTDDELGEKATKALDLGDIEFSNDLDGYTRSEESSVNTMSDDIE